MTNEMAALRNSATSSPEDHEDAIHAHDGCAYSRLDELQGGIRGNAIGRDHKDQASLTIGDSVEWLLAVLSEWIA